jgi:hypothetical protein
MPRLWKAKAPVAALLILYMVASASLAQGACGSAGYSYAGVSGSDRVAGVAARITPLAAFDVRGGHVASYVGVGGVGQGPYGSTEWIQVGLAAFKGRSVHSLYYEIAPPGGVPTYHEVATNVTAGETRRVAVLEMARRVNWWRVWVDGNPVTKPIFLPGSHRRWRPVATAESLGGDALCNGYAYKFASVSIARTPGGTWTPLNNGTLFSDPGYSVAHRTRTGFVAARSQQSDDLSRRRIVGFRG